MQDYGMYGGGSPMYGAYDAYGGPGGVAVGFAEADSSVGGRRQPTAGEGTWRWAQVDDHHEFAFTHGIC